METLESKPRLEYEVPIAEIVRLGTEDILSTSKPSKYGKDDLNLF